MEYRKGERVRHPTKRDWGLGEILEDSKENAVRVFFVGVGEKELSLRHVQPVRVAGEEGRHPVLDNLRVTRSPSGIKYRSLAQSIEIFLEEFPEGFYGERFLNNERNYKVKAHQLAEELLGEAELKSLVDREDYLEVSKRALKVANATNVIFPNEKMALKDALQDLDSRKDFALALLHLLYGKVDIEKRFSGFADVLENLEAAKWTIATYFPFFVHPTHYMFVKPTITQHAAEVCGFEIKYRPHPNWGTYNAILNFSRYLFSELSALKPRDMIDVQSFMWCISPATYEGK